MVRRISWFQEKQLTLPFRLDRSLGTKSNCSKATSGAQARGKVLRSFQTSSWLPRNILTGPSTLAGARRLTVGTQCRSEMEVFSLAGFSLSFYFSSQVSMSTRKPWEIICLTRAFGVSQSLFFF